MVTNADHANLRVFSGCSKGCARPPCYNHPVSATSLVLALVLAAPAPGPVPPPDDGAHFDRSGRALSFDEAIGLSEQLPSTKIRAQAMRERELGDRRISGTIAQPQIWLQPGVRLLPREAQAFTPQAMITQTWSLGRLGSARRKAAKAERTAMSSELSARQLAHRLEAARTWIDLHTAQRELALARHEGDVATEWVARAEAALRAELILAPDVAEARAYAAEVRSRHLELEGRVHDLGLQLARDVGEDPWRPLVADGATPDPRLPDEAEIARRFADVGELPEVQALRLAAVAKRAYAVESRAQYRGSQLTLGGQIDRDERDGFLAYGIVALSVPTRGAGVRQHGEIMTEVHRLEAEAADTQRALSSRLATTLHDLHHTQVVVDNLGGALLPELRAAATAHEKARDVGEGTVFELFYARRRVLAAENALVAAEGAQTWARLQTWLLLAELEAPR